MIKYKIFIVLSLVGIMSCNESQNTIDKEVFQEALYDMYLAEVKSRLVDSNKVLSNEINKEELNGYYKSILEKYKINIEDFRATMKWYTEHPLLLDTLYQNLIDSNSKVDKTVLDPNFKLRKSDTIIR